MGLFTKRLSETPPAMCCVMTDDGKAFISPETRDYLVERGRIYLTGYYNDERERLVFTYRRITRPVNNRLP